MGLIWASWRDGLRPTEGQNVGINHGGFDIGMAQKFLDGADVVAVLEAVGGEGVAEDVTTDALGDATGADGLFNRFLQTAFVAMVADNFAATRIFTAG